MIKLKARTIIIFTVITMTVWIGYETYSTLTAATRKLSVKQELLRELNKSQNEEIVEDLGSRISY